MASRAARVVQHISIMRAALLINSRAGKSRAGAPLSEAALVSALEAAGWTVPCRITEEQLDRNPSDLARHADVVVTVGGDGTVARVAKRLAEPDLRGMAMTILPAGTINNVARSLGISVDPMVAAAQLARTTERRVDLGTISMGARKEYFLEGFSAGVLAHVLAEKAGREHKSLPKATSLLARELKTYEPHHYLIDADEHDLSGNYLLIAIMNIRTLGPALRLAPGAACDDGQLEVVRVRPEIKDALIEALEDVEIPADIELPSFEVSRARRVHIRSDLHWAHRDDASCQIDGAIEIGIEAGAVRMLVPGA